MPLQHVSILLYGRDTQLLETRRLILEKSGAHVWIAMNLAEISNVTSASPIDVIVLCHSLPNEECTPALALARTRWPQIQRLALISGHRGCHNELLEEFADVTRGPVFLLEKLDRMIAAGRDKISAATQPIR